jgi:hypothetical protein
MKRSELKQIIKGIIEEELDISTPEGLVDHFGNDGYSTVYIRELLKKKFDLSDAKINRLLEDAGVSDHIDDYFHPQKVKE